MGKNQLAIAAQDDIINQENIMAILGIHEKMNIRYDQRLVKFNV